MVEWDLGGEGEGGCFWMRIRVELEDGDGINEQNCIESR